MPRKRRLSALLVLLAISLLLVTACNFPPSTPDMLATYAAETVAARLTESGGTQTPGGPPTDTPAPPTGIPTLVPPTPTMSPTTPCVDKVHFLDDVTVEDGTYFDPNETFTKTWSIRNGGTCTWTTNYALVFDSGNIMGADPVKPLTGNVLPGATIHLSVEMKAPAALGHYRGYWRLRNDEGVLFGWGTSADKAWWVDINVGPEIVYDFVQHACDVTWESAAGALACPGTTADIEGFVVKLDDPRLETGGYSGEWVLETHPQFVNNGWIQAEFPAIDVQAGDHFKTQIGCLFNAGSCDVRMQFNYIVEPDPLAGLGNWIETYDGNLTDVDIDLTPLAGKSVKFIFFVHAHGLSSQDWAVWVAPRIER
jgi:hypothetical protein